MNFLYTIAGAGLGFLVGGPVGAVVGAGAGVYAGKRQATAVAAAQAVAAGEAPPLDPYAEARAALYAPDRYNPNDPSTW